MLECSFMDFRNDKFTDLCLFLTSIAPTVYRKAKMAPESKREACLIKELEDILEKEGLSTNPSEKGSFVVKLFTITCAGKVHLLLNCLQ